MELVILLIVAGVVVLLGGVGLLVSTVRPRRRVLPPPRPGDADRLPGVGDDAEVPRDTASRSVATLDLPDGDLVEVPVEGGDAESALPGFEVPESAAGRLTRLRSRLSRSQGSMGQALFSLLSRDTLDEDTWDEVEETLLQADVGVAATMEVVEHLRTKVRVLGTRTPGGLRELLEGELLQVIGGQDRTLRTTRHVDGTPAVVLVVGVNGTGKTTTCGKLARVLVAEGRTVVLGAADTFRAAAADQLSTWGDRVGAAVVRGPEGGDPAAVAFDAVATAAAADIDTVVIDTAGRLHTKAGLMDELAKVKRVVEKRTTVDEVLLVLDATTGQNGVTQAKVFTEVVQVTGIVLTKLDGTAKGGIVIAVQRELGIPVKLVGLGEGPDDLAPFEPTAFVDALLGEADIGV